MLFSQRRKKILNVLHFVFAVGHKRQVKLILLILDYFTMNAGLICHLRKILTWRMLLILSGHPGKQYFTSSFHFHLAQIFTQILLHMPWAFICLCMTVPILLPIHWPLIQMLWINECRQEYKPMAINRQKQRYRFHSQTLISSHNSAQSYNLI